MKEYVPPDRAKQRVLNDYPTFTFTNLKKKDDLSWNLNSTKIKTTTQQGLKSGAQFENKRTKKLGANGTMDNNLSRDYLRGSGIEPSIENPIETTTTIPEEAGNNSAQIYTRRGTQRLRPVKSFVEKLKMFERQ